MADPRFEADAKQVHEIAPWAYDEANDRYKVSVDGAAPVEVVVMDNVAKRDTTAVTSAWIPIDGLKTKRLTVVNLTDQQVSVLVAFSRDGVAITYSGQAVGTVNSNSLGFFTEAIAHMGTVIKGYIRFTITPTVAPTSGNITVLFQGMAL